MDDLLPQREVTEKNSVRVSLIDYLVLKIVSEWNALAETDPLSVAGVSARGKPLTWEESNFASEEAGARLRALIVLIAGELTLDGFPIELGLRFQNPDLPGLDIVSSAAIDDALGSMIDAACLAGPDRSAPHYTLTDRGKFYLGRAQGQIEEYEKLFESRMPPVFFAAYDFIRYYRKQTGGVRLRERISELLRKHYGRPATDLRLEMIDLGVRLLVDGNAPRGYYFHKKFRELTPQRGRLVDSR